MIFFLFFFFLFPFSWHVSADMKKYFSKTVFRILSIEIGSFRVMITAHFIHFSRGTSLTKRSWTKLSEFSEKLCFFFRKKKYNLKNCLTEFSLFFWIQKVSNEKLVFSNFHERLELLLFFIYLFLIFEKELRHRYFCGNANNWIYQEKNNVSRNGLF